MARGHFMRYGLSMARLSQEPAWRCDERARHHEFSARRLGGLARCVEFLVTAPLPASAFAMRNAAFRHYSAIQTSVPLGSKPKSAIKSTSARWMQPCEGGSPMDA